jgi:hypothetical protein
MGEKGVMGATMGLKGRLLTVSKSLFRIWANFKPSQWKTKERLGKDETPIGVVEDYLMRTTVGVHDLRGHGDIAHVDRVLCAIRAERMGVEVVAFARSV